jgi:DNA replication protein DnaC
MTDEIQPDLKTTMRRLKLGKLLETLPERITLARQQKMPHQDFLLLLLSDEVARRDAAAVTMRAQRADLEPQMRLENWDPTAKVHFDQALLNELASLRFVEAGRHVAIVGPVGVGKTFLAHALGHAACRRGHSVLAIRADKMLKNLKHARLDHSYEAELRKLLAVDLLLVDDFGLDAMDHQESRDAYELFLERDRAGSIVVTSNRGPDEWLATFADPTRAQAAIDRFTSNAYDLVIEGESYRKRLKPTLTPDAGTVRPGQKRRKSGKRRTGR